MANFVAGILGSAADGESFTGQAHRLGMASHATIIGDTASALRSRSGIIPGGGTPLDVTALGTPAMKINVLAGTCAVQDTGTTGGVHTVTITTATNLDIAAANVSNPRIDLVVAKVFADGTSATNCTVEVLTGTPAASPVRPSIASPPTNTHYFPLAQVRVDANVTTIVAAKVTKAAGDGQFTCAPGGTIRGVTRVWAGVRVGDNVVGPNGSGNYCSVTVTAAQCTPGIYLATYQAETGMSGGFNILVYQTLAPNNPNGSYAVNISDTNSYSFNTTRVVVFDTQPVTDQGWVLNATVGPGTGTATFRAGSRVEVTRIADL